MQVYMASDPASRQALDRQMISWDENLEKLHIEQYQLRCYLAALQGADLPTTKVRQRHFRRVFRALIAMFGHQLAPAYLADNCILITGSPNGPVLFCSRASVVCRRL